MDRRVLAVLSSLSCLSIVAGSTGHAQAGRPQFTTYFTREEFHQRRAHVSDAIGTTGLALMQGAPAVHSATIFRQSNEFFHLTGVIIPQAYLLIDGGQRRSVVYLPHRDPRRAQTEGDLLSAEDADTIVKLTGIDEVRGSDLLADDLKSHVGKSAALYTPFQPAEGDSESRDGAKRRNADAAADPWDGRPSRESRFIDLIHSRVPSLEVKDLSPILDEMRAIKSPAEMAVIDRATRIGGEAILEAMRSTKPGVKQSEIDAVARFIFVRHGAQGEAYRAIVASGPTAWNPHHRAGERVMPDGELVLMDYCPDVSYYRCDITRMWPVNGKFSSGQRELYGFYLGVYESILYGIKPNLTAQAVLQEAVPTMDRLLAETPFSKPAYAKAARMFVDTFRASAARPNAGLGHAVGMSTHDIGGGTGLLKPGLVFTIEPALTVPEEQLYLRVEDMIVITESGAHVTSDWVPRAMDRIEKVMTEPGLLQKYGPIEFSRPTTSSKAPKQRQAAD